MSDARDDGQMQYRVAVGAEREHVAEHATEEAAWRWAQRFNDAAGGSLGPDPFVVQSRPRVYWEDV